MKTIEAASLLLVLLSFLGCHENPEVHYATTSDAIADRAFERGWLPEVLLPDSTDIQESHDLDTNHGEMTFRYTSQFVQRLEHNCARIPPHELVHSPFSSWPKFLNKAETSMQLKSQNSDAYKCGEFIIIVNSSKQLGYAWH